VVLGTSVVLGERRGGGESAARVRIGAREALLAEGCEGGVQAAAFLPGHEGVERLGLEGVVEPVAAIG